MHPKKIHYCLSTPSLYLVPYSSAYIPEYHSWFASYPQILHLTGSEPLTLEEEVENHRSWVEDQTKCTFIVFLRENENKQDKEGMTQREKDKMIGDVNLFFSQWIQMNQAEINIMIAVPEYRGKGLAKQIMEAVQMFAKGVYNKDTIIAKIKQDNQGSIKFFQKQGYNFIQHNHYHNEVQYRKNLQISKQDALKLLQNCYSMKQVPAQQLYKQQSKSD